MAKVMKKKPVVKTRLTAEEKHWDEAEKLSKEIIDSFFNRYLPINFAPKDIDLEKSVDWRVIARDDVPQSYSNEEELPGVEYLAEEIAYHYLLIILEGFCSELSEYDCHDSSYFQNIMSSY